MKILYYEQQCKIIIIINYFILLRSFKFSVSYNFF